MKQAELVWQDGQPLSSEFDDVYFSRDGGMAETEHVFLHNNGLPQRWQSCKRFVIGETGFGSGLNFLITLHHWLASSEPDARLYYYSVEKYPLAAEHVQQALALYPQLAEYLPELLAVYPPAISGMHQRELFNGRVCLVLLFDDVETALAGLHVEVDAWYLDGFAPAKNPAMWSNTVFAQLARLSHQHTTLSTYTAAGFVRRGLAAQGFAMDKVAGFGNKRSMLAGRLQQPLQRHSQQPWFEVPQQSPGQRRVAVIGAGIAGVTTAWALARRGWTVQLIDQHDSIAAEASGNPQGVVLPRISRESSAAAQFDNSAFVYAVYRLNQLQQRYPELGWRQTGVIQLPSSSRIEKHMAYGAFDQQLAHSIDAAQLADYCGLDLHSDGLLYPLAGYLHPPRLCQTLCEDAGENLQLMNNTRVNRIEQQHGHWQLFDEHDRPLLDCDALVIANGFRVNRFAQTAELPVTAVRGQVSYLSATEQSRQLRCPICFEGYLLPAVDGRHVSGASFKPDNDCADVIDAEHEENMTALQQWLPQLFPARSSMQGRAAVRAVTADRLPVVGAVADQEFFYNTYADLSRGRAARSYAPGRYLAGLYVNVGHGARGLTSSFLCAEMLAAQINNEPSPVYKNVQDALHPARFIIRALKKGKPVSS